KQHVLRYVICKAHDLSSLRHSRPRVRLLCLLNDAVATLIYTLSLHDALPISLLRGATLRDLVAAHEAEGNAVTILSARVPDPTGYGRIVRDAAGAVTEIGRAHV